MVHAGIRLAFQVLVFVCLFGSILGCRTATQPISKMRIEAGWQTRQGQAVWKPGRGRPELAGELFVALASSDRCFVEFTKTPFPVVVALRNSGRWWLELPGARRTYSGKGNPPSQLLWLYLGQALANEALPVNFEFERKLDGTWRLKNASTGEVLEGYLSP